MPRPRDIVGLKTTDAQRREAVRNRCAEVMSPYRVFKQLREDGFTQRGYCLVYVNPFNFDRESIMQDIGDAATARDLKELLEQAWVRGYLASGE